MPLIIIPTSQFSYGQIDIYDPRNIPRGAASSSLNWITKGDHIEIRPGQAYMGTSSVNTGNGKVTGIKKLTNAIGVEVLFGTYGKKLKYYDETTSEWIENGVDLLGSATVDANGYGIEDIFMSEYTGLAGNQMFLTSPNCAGYYKIMTANPGSSTNVYNSSINFKGYNRIDTNRTQLWGRTTDQTGLYGSYIDNQIYTSVTGEATVSLGGTLAFKAGNAAGTCFAVAITITATNELYTDNFNGTLTGSLGGTGTINYTSGVYTLSNAGVGTAAYQWENSNNKGITDFRKSSTRLAGEGFIFRQDEGGGALMSVGQYNQVYYCFHIKKTWVLSIGSDDTSATNLPYRQLVGIPNQRASVETGEGIYYVDTSNENDIKLRRLTYDIAGSQQVLPVPISNNLKLNKYNFDQAASAAWGDLVLFSCATKDSTQTINGVTVSVNNRVLVYNTLWKSFDVLDYGVTCFAIYNGNLIGGDSLSNNFITLFSGYDDFGDGSIQNFWIGNLENLQFINPKSRRISYPELHKVKKFCLQGHIQPDQKIKVSISVDNGSWVEIGGSDTMVNGVNVHTYAIEGTGSYIDPNSSINVGAQYLGNHMIGGGTDGVIAFGYERLFSIDTDKFEYIKIKYEAMAVGYCSVMKQQYWDVRAKGKKVARKYRG